MKHISRKEKGSIQKLRKQGGKVTARSGIGVKTKAIKKNTPEQRRKRILFWLKVMSKLVEMWLSLTAPRH